MPTFSRQEIQKSRSKFKSIKRSSSLSIGYHIACWILEMIVSTPEILWHGGANENGKPDPVFSVDMHPSGVFATAGVDDHLPPKGTVRVSINKDIS